MVVMHAMLKTLRELNTAALIQWLLLGVVFVFGLVLLPVGLNTFETTKVLWLFGTITIALVLLAVSHFIPKHLPSNTTLHPVMQGLGAVALSTILSILLGNAHPLAQITGFGGSWLAFLVLASFGFWYLHKPSSLRLAATFGIIGGILTLFLMGELIGLKASVLYTFFLGNSLAQGSIFTPVGSVFILAQLCVLAVVGCGVAAATMPQHRTIFLAGLVLNLLGLLTAGWLSLPGNLANPVILPWSASWSIGLDSLRNPRQAVIGVGPENFSDAFTQFKPGWLNTTPWWNVEFTQGSTLSFTILVTHGILGLLAWLWLSWLLLKNSRQFWQTAPIATSLSHTALLLTWLVPPTTFLLGVWGVCLAYLVAETKQLYPTWEEHATAPAWMPLFIWKHIHAAYQSISSTLASQSRHAVLTNIGKGSVFALLGLSLGYCSLQLFRTEHALFQATAETQKGNIVQVYEQQKSAISLYPYNDAARRQYALTNLAIASAVSNKADLTEEDGQKIAILVQQAIREARAATLINPHKAQNWETLGDIYTNFIGIMDNSDALALEAYRQAILYSPTSPNLYIKLGGVFYRKGSFNEALISFEQAARTKPDLANAYYNAANTFKQLNDIPGATSAYQQTLLVLEKTSGASSEEYLKANLELEELQQLNTASGSAETAK